MILMKSTKLEWLVIICLSLNGLTIEVLRHWLGDFYQDSLIRDLKDGDN